MEARHTQARSPHENGKVEQAHYRVKKAIANQLTLRGSSDFESRQKYEAFLAKLFVQLNTPRKERFEEERAHMGPLPKRPLTTYKPISVRVSKGSTIRVQNNFYSVPSRLIGERVDVCLYGKEVQVWYRNRFMERMERMPRFHGRSRHQIRYKHVISSLVRKPGAFADYRYRSDFFPTHRFQMAYEALLREHGKGTRADKEYLYTSQHVPIPACSHPHTEHQRPSPHRYGIHPQRYIVLSFQGALVNDLTRLIAHLSLVGILHRIACPARICLQQAPFRLPTPHFSPAGREGLRSIQLDFSTSTFESEPW